MPNWGDYVFKVGDKVIAVKPKNTSEHPIWSSAMDVFDGQVGEVLRIQPDFLIKNLYVVGFSIPKWDYGKCFTFRESWLVPTSEFKPNNNELDELFKECDL